MIVAVLDGWASSKKHPLDPIIREALQTLSINAAPYFCASAKIGRHKAKALRKFVIGNDSPDETLLLAGKSLGARNLILAINSLPPLCYRRIRIVTIDPCWPMLWDWTPNLSNQWLSVQSHRFASARMSGYNILLDAPRRQQAGCRVAGINIKNILVRDCTHQSISSHPVVLDCIQKSIQSLSPYDRWHDPE